MKDPFENRASGLESPARGAAAVVPDDDDANVPMVTRSLYVGFPGDVTVTMLDGNVVTFSAVPAGLLPIRVTRVHATGTTATGIVALW